MKYGVCQNCGATGIIEKHHIFFRSKAKALVDCKLNLIDLCQECHRGTNGVHGPHGHKLDIKLKRQAQDKLIKVHSMKPYNFLYLRFSANNFIFSFLIDFRISTPYAYKYSASHSGQCQIKSSSALHQRRLQRQPHLQIL